MLLAARPHLQAAYAPIFHHRISGSKKRSANTQVSTSEKGMASGQELDREEKVILSVANEISVLFCLVK